MAIHLTSKAVVLQALDTVVPESPVAALKTE